MINPGRNRSITSHVYHQGKPGQELKAGPKERPWRNTHWLVPHSSLAQPVSYSSGVHHPQCAGPMTPITKKMPHEPILMSVFSYVEWTYTYTGSLQCPPGVRGQGSHWSKHGVKECGGIRLTPHPPLLSALRERPATAISLETHTSSWEKACAEAQEESGLALTTVCLQAERLPLLALAPRM